MCKECGCGLPGESPARISAHHHEHGHEHEHEHEHGQEHGHGHAHIHDGGFGHQHEHGPGHHHGEEHAHSHTHLHTHPHEEESHSREDPSARRTLELHRAILEKNDRLAERNRGFFRARGLLVLNVVSSPGSGKTTFL